VTRQHLDGVQQLTVSIHADIEPIAIDSAAMIAPARLGIHHTAHLVAPLGSARSAITRWASANAVSHA
jgi:hypothetical protein